MKSKTDSNAKESQIKLTVNRQSWSRVRSLKDSGPDDKHFVLEINRQGEASVRFGDGLKGRRPPAGAKITVTYRLGGGRAGKTGAAK